MHIHICMYMYIYICCWPETVRAVVHFFILGVGGWVGGGIITFGTTHIMSVFHHHVIMQLLTYALHHTLLTEIRMEGLSDTQ